jgi:hypothetical protein
MTVPQPASLMGPPPETGTLLPETIQPAMPPAGTQARAPYGPPPPASGVAPAMYQYPVAR